jgi:hypothetical protein
MDIWRQLFGKKNVDTAKAIGRAALDQEIDKLLDSVPQDQWRAKIKEWAHGRLGV